MRVKCLAQEHNTMSQARVRTSTDQFGGERTNYEAKLSGRTKEKITKIKSLDAGDHATNN